MEDHLATLHFSSLLFKKFLSLLKFTKPLLHFKSMAPVGIAVCALNQWALDFSGNCERIIESIKESIKLGAKIRVGPELEICGYSCEDAFYEFDTTFHSWQILGEIIKEDFKDILIDVG